MLIVCIIPHVVGSLPSVGITGYMISSNIPIKVPTVHHDSLLLWYGSSKSSKVTK